MWGVTGKAIDAKTGMFWSYAPSFVGSLRFVDTEWKDIDVPGCPHAYATFWLALSIMLS